jgi:hypothetical protein
MKGYSEDAWEPEMKAQEAILRATAKQIIRLSRPPRSSASRIGVCGAGGSGTRSTGTMGFWIGGEASQAQRGIGPTGHLTCQEQARKTPGLVNNKSHILLRLYPTPSFSLILLLMMKCGIPRASVCLCRNRRGIPWRDVDYVVDASRPLRPRSRQAWLLAKERLWLPWQMLAAGQELSVNQAASSMLAFLLVQETGVWSIGLAQQKDLYQKDNYKCTKYPTGLREST